jgi:arylsulfatase A-like enzyme
MIRSLLLLLALSGLSCSNVESNQGRTSTPNVVLIFADDLAYADIGSFGATAYTTPELDKLASQGARFTDFYVSQPVCSASRSSLLTGSYANRLGIHGALGPSNTHGINADETTLAELFKSKGYSTAIFGKWHLGHLPEFLPTQHGFDEFYGIPYSNDMWPFHPENPEAWPDLPTIEGTALEGTNVVGYNTDQSRFTTDFTNRTVEFIEKNAAEHKPFFVYLAHPMPHVPLFVSEERAGKSGAGLFGDVIQEIDWSVGQVMNTLERLGIDQNTIVLFISDNGPWLSYGNHAGSAEPLREGKGTAFDGGVRVPFLVSWPGTIDSGTEVSTPAMTIDIFPTIAEILDAPLPDKPIDGKSIWNLMNGSRTEPVQEAYFFYYNRNELHAMRSGKWKLNFPHSYRTMEGREPGKDGIPGKYDYSATIGLELFDLESDIAETTDVSSQYPEVMERLMKLADAKRAELGDALQGVEGFGKREPGRSTPPNTPPNTTQ